MKYYVFWRMKVKPTSTGGRITTPYPIADIDGPFDEKEVGEHTMKLLTNWDIDKVILIKGEMITLKSSEENNI